jgi:two-component system response regulator RegA
MDEPMTDIQTLLQPDPSLLLVDDDKAFLTRLERAMVRRGFDVRTADNVADGPTAVTAVKLGAVDYLSKPADADDVINALLALGAAKPEPPENPMSADRVRWEHIQRVYELCERNVSETARRLNMHRRTLQRILAKRAPK